MLKTVECFCIDSAVLGTEKHLIVEDGFRWSDSVPRSVWHLTGKMKSGRCMDTLMALGHRQVPGVPQKHANCFASLFSGSVPPRIQWQHALPPDDFRIFFKNVVEETSKAFPELPREYCEGAWAAGTRLLSALKPAKVEAETWNKMAAETVHNAAALESFRPNRLGYAPVVEYDRFSTRTGRLTVKSGPQILTLKKECRSVVKSAFEGGKIFNLDFRALEVRILAAEAGRWFGPTDVYEDVARELFGGSVERDAAKVAVISELYGAGRGALSARLRVPEKKVDEFLKKIRDFFCISALRGRLEDQLRERGKILNKFGRPLMVPESSENLLVNTYAQSTGVDVSLSGFDSIVSSLGSEGIRPLFVLHDALILDVHPDRFNDVVSCTSVSVDGYSHPFPLKIE